MDHRRRKKLVAAATMFVVHCAYATAIDYRIDSAATSVTFEVRSLHETKLRGVFDKTSGRVSLDAKSGSGSMDIVIDARSLDAGDAALTRIMRGGELFDVARYPEIEYKADHLMLVRGGLGRIDGELTLLGVTRPVPLTVTEYDCPYAGVLTRQRCVVSATAAFSRSMFGMTRYRVLAGDEVEVTIRAVAVSTMD